jgi:hypothetical protein
VTTSSSPTAPCSRGRWAVSLYLCCREDAAPAGELLRLLRWFERGSFFARRARVLRRYGIYRGLGILSKESAPAFSPSSATPQQFSSWNAFLCFQWFGPRTIVHSNLNVSDICTVGAQSLFRSLGGKPKSTVESSTCIVSGRSAAW